MRKSIKDRVIVGDYLTVKPHQVRYIGKGDEVEEVKVLEVITLDTDPDGDQDIPYPLFKVEKPDGDEDTYTHKFFEKIVKGGK